MSCTKGWRVQRHTRRVCCPRIRCDYNDRPDISEGLASVYLKFKQLKVPAELHIYAGSGHGFGLRANDTKPAGKWIERFEEWLADSKFLNR